MLYLKDRLYVSNVLTLQDDLLEYADVSRLSVHPGSENMYHDLRSHLLWPTMRRDIAAYVSTCATCQRVKVEHQKPTGMLQPLPIPIRKWGNMTMDFLIGLPMTWSSRCYIGYCGSVNEVCSFSCNQSYRFLSSE